MSVAILFGPLRRRRKPITSLVVGAYPTRNASYLLHLDAMCDIKGFQRGA
jgi:hypothetical protein